MFVMCPIWKLDFRSMSKVSFYLGMVLASPWKPPPLAGLGTDKMIPELLDLPNNHAGGVSRVLVSAKCKVKTSDRLVTFFVVGTAMQGEALAWREI